jgi:CBS domain-containing protein
VRDGRLVGIVTERDFMNVTAQLIQNELRAETLLRAEEASRPIAPPRAKV